MMRGIFGTKHFVVGVLDLFRAGGVIAIGFTL
jgi:hypothetical protein